MFLEIVVLKKFPNFTGKQVAGLQKCNFLKKKLQHRFFPVKFAKFLNALFYRTSPVGASESFGFSA